MNTNHFDRVLGRLAGMPVPADDVPPPPPGARATLRERPKRADPITWVLPGFCDGVRITTSFGDLPIEALRKRDPLRSQAGPIVPVEWIDRIRLDEGFLADNPDARPVRIPAGTFGDRRPERDLIVSPQQYVNVSPSPYAQDFRPARELTGRPGIVRHSADSVCYTLFHCGAPALLRAEGVCVRVRP